ncbi:unnamed protein product, partial [Rotaria sp. Silwood1]
MEEVIQDQDVQVKVFHRYVSVQISEIIAEYRDTLATVRSTSVQLPSSPLNPTCVHDFGSPRSLTNPSPHYDAPFILQRQTIITQASTIALYFSSKLKEKP